MKYSPLALLIFISLNLFSQPDPGGDPDNGNGVNIGLSIGKTQKAPVLNIELGFKKKNFMLAYHFTPQLSTSNPVLQDIRLSFVKFPVQPYFGVGYQFFSTDGHDTHDIRQIVPPNKFNLVYGLRYQYRKFILTAGMNGIYRVVTVGFIGTLPKVSLCEQ